MSEFNIKEYHILFHDKSKDVLLATNAIKEKVESVSFKREQDDLIWLVNNEKKYIFKGLESQFWDKVSSKNALLVEFSPVGPISEYVVML